MQVNLEWVKDALRPTRVVPGLFSVLVQVFLDPGAMILTVNSYCIHRLNGESHTTLTKENA